MVKITWNQKSQLINRLSMAIVSRDCRMAGHGEEGGYRKCISKYYPKARSDAQSHVRGMEEDDLIYLMHSMGIEVD